MIRIPELGQAGNPQINAPTVRAGAAMAPTAALGNVAQAIGGIGEAFQQHADQVQKLHNMELESKARNQLAGDYAALQIELEKDPDPASRIARARAFFDQSKGLADNPDLPPIVRDSLRLHVDDFASRGMAQVGEQSANLQQKRTFLQAQNELDRHVMGGDTAAANGVLDRLVSNGLLLPEEAEAKRVDIAGRIQIHGAKVAIDQDAAGWLEANPKDKVPAGMDPLQWGSLQNSAKEAVRGQTYEDVQAIGDAIVSGDIDTPEELKAKAGHLRPTVQAKLGAMLAERAEDDYKAKVSTPEYQQAVVGKVSALLADYNPAADDFDESFVEMDSLTRSLPPGAIRDELTRRIDGVRAGKLDEIKTHADSANKALDEAYKAGRFGKAPKVEPMRTGRAIADGFLRDWNKLKDLGFSDEQASMIKDAMGSDKKPSDSAARSIFKEEWKRRPDANFQADPLTLATADAILGGSETIAYKDPEAEDAAITAKNRAERTYGAAKQKLAEFIKINPQATPEQIDGKILEISGEETHRALKSGIYTPKETSGGPKGASDATAAVPVGKSLTEVVKHFEAGGAPGGFHKKAYWDYGQWSIGYGTRSKEGETINQAEADKRLAAELASSRAGVEKAAKAAGMSLSAHELDALTSFHYNTGRVGTLLAGGTRSKAEIADAMLLYRNADGQRLKGLERRRAAERELFLKGYNV